MVLGQRRWARSGRKEGGKVGHGKGERKEELGQMRKEKGKRIFPFSFQGFERDLERD